MSLFETKLGLMLFTSIREYFTHINIEKSGLGRILSCYYLPIYPNDKCPYFK